MHPDSGIHSALIVVDSRVGLRPTYRVGGDCQTGVLADIYIAPLQGYYSEALPALARLKRTALAQAFLRKVCFSL